MGFNGVPFSGPYHFTYITYTLLKIKKTKNKIGNQFHAFVTVLQALTESLSL